MARLDTTGEHHGEWDYRVIMLCGCAVTFTAASGYHSSRMDACEKHCARGPDGWDERARIVEQARSRMLADTGSRRGRLN